jgi:hypothetical protein
MTSVNFIFDNGAVVLRVERRGIERFVPTRYDVREHEWDAQTETLIATGYTSRSRRLAEYSLSMERDLRLLRGVTNSRAHSCDDVAAAYHQLVAGYRMLGIYTQTLSDELKRQGQSRTARGYLTTLRRFIEFNNGYDIPLSDMDSDIITRFDQTLEADLLMRSTISFYMRTLRAIYNKSILENIIPPRLDDPFEDAYTYIELPASQPYLNHDWQGTEAYEHAIK